MKFIRNVIIPSVVYSFLIRIIISIVYTLTTKFNSFSDLSKNFSNEFRNVHNQGIQLISFGIIFFTLLIYFLYKKVYSTHK